MARSFALVLLVLKQAFPQTEDCPTPKTKGLAATDFSRASSAPRHTRRLGFDTLLACACSNGFEKTHQVHQKKNPTCLPLQGWGQHPYLYVYLTHRKEQPLKAVCTNGHRSTQQIKDNRNFPNATLIRSVPMARRAAHLIQPSKLLAQSFEGFFSVVAFRTPH